MNGWDVFNNVSASTSNTILYTGSSTWDYNTTVNAPYIPSNVIYRDPLLVEGAPKPKDPLRWLHDRVSEVCDLGRLN